MIDYTRLSKQDARRICNIIKKYSRHIDDHISAEMDLIACHIHCVPLDLEAMESGPVFDVLHDIAGIGRHLDRHKLELRDCFWPRFAKKDWVHH